MTATLFIPQQLPEPALTEGLSCEPTSLNMGVLCVAAGLLGVGLPDVQAFCVNFATGVMAYVGSEWQESAMMRNVDAEQALNKRLPGHSFFGNAHAPATCLYGPLLLVERRNQRKSRRAPTQ